MTIKMLTCNNPDEISAMLKREQEAQPEVQESVRAIVSDVQTRGDEAVRLYTERFDGVSQEMLGSLEVGNAEIRAAYNSVEPAFVAILQNARANIEAYHQKQKRTGFLMAEQPGVMLGQKITPLDKVGVYVPGGTAAYPSTTLMDIVPAKIAGVGEVVMATPPGKDGKIAPDILVAADIAGVDRIFKIGGAQAVAALAYGTQTVPRVDKIVGPGNIYVATAKRLVYGMVDIDMFAGPSEILIIADETANPEHVAVDMLSQAEHDKLAAAFLVTESSVFAKSVAEYLDTHLQTLPRQEIARAAIQGQSAIILTDSLEHAAAISNNIAPEHLEICTKEPFALLSSIRHAGAIFLGMNAPEALGDYFAGPNHTLPTSGTARFSSGLSVDDFIKKSSVIYYEYDALRAVSEQVAAFAEHEGLDAHARSIKIRVNGKEKPEHEKSAD